MIKLLGLCHCLSWLVGWLFIALHTTRCPLAYTCGTGNASHRIAYPFSDRWSSYFQRLHGLHRWRSSRLHNHNKRIRGANSIEVHRPARWNLSQPAHCPIDVQLKFLSPALSLSLSLSLSLFLSLSLLFFVRGYLIC